MKRVLLPLLPVTICAVLYMYTQMQGSIAVVPYRKLKRGKETLEYKSEDIKCPPKELRYLNASHPNFKSQVCLVSFPGSGNTWIRHLLQEATGFYTGSMYNDWRLSHGGLTGESRHMNRGDCIVYKSHFFHPKQIARCKKAVFLMRNPFDAFVALFHYKRAGNIEEKHTYRVKDNIFKTTSWNSFIKPKLRIWQKLVWDTTNVFQGPLHLVFYEELKTNPTKAISHIMDFLNLKPSTKDLWCMNKNGEGQYHRNSSGSKLLDLYNMIKEQQIKTAIMNVSALIKRRLPERNIDILLHYSNQYH